MTFWMIQGMLIGMTLDPIPMCAGMRNAGKLPQGMERVRISIEKRMKETGSFL